MNLAILLSKLKVFNNPDPNLEQYPTDSEIANQVLNNVNLIDHIKGKTIADFGAGTGILGIGCTFFNPSIVYLIEKDVNAITDMIENLRFLEKVDHLELLPMDVIDFNKKVNIVIQNPPFGTKQKRIDIQFLDKAFSIANVVYSFHKTITKDYIQEFANRQGFDTTHTWDYQFPLKQTMKQHKKTIQRIQVTVFRFEKRMRG